MTDYRYVTLDPTGNLTTLVLDPVPPEERPEVTASLLPSCEQVGYLVPPLSSGSAARLEMMGGEFCANATMATACWIAGESGIRPEETRRLKLEVTGAKEPLTCTVRLLTDGYEGTVEMPAACEFFSFTADGYDLRGIRLDGIAHLVFPGSLPCEEAERILRQSVSELPDDAVGLLQWDGRFMRPLVYVRTTGSCVWETGCGSGSTAIGLLRARETDGQVTETEVLQPGGTLLVRVQRNGTVTLTGKVRLSQSERDG